MIYSAIEKYDARDFEEQILGSNSAEGKCFSNIKYNQKLVDKYSCTGQAASGVISDVTGYALPLSFRRMVWERQLDTGAVDGIGDTFQNGMKQAVKVFNEQNPELPFTLAYYRMSKIKNILHLIAILNNGSSILAGYTGKLYSDAQDNGVIDNVDNVDGGGHCIRIVKAFKEDGIWKIKYCDNYEGVNKYNIITIKDFLKNENFFLGGYYIKKIAKTS